MDLIKPFNYVTNYNFLTEFYICGYINTDNYNKEFLDQLRRSLDPNINIDRVPITIYIDSIGGSIINSLDIAFIILNAPIKTICIGRNIVGSASVIFIACTERYVYKNNYNFTIHSIKYDSPLIIELNSYADSIYNLLPCEDYTDRAFDLNKSSILSKLIYYLYITDIYEEPSLFSELNWSIIDIFINQTFCDSDFLSEILFNNESYLFNNDDMINLRIVDKILE